jgi:hypothetical protein
MVLTKKEIQARYRLKNKEKIKERRKRIEVICPDCSDVRMCRVDKKRQTDRCNKCSIRHTRMEQGEILHSLSNHRLYKRWAGMKARVNDPVKRYSYLDKGVVVCDEWKTNFMAFYEWSIKNGFNENLEIDRIDNNGNYCPENCRWITHKENCLNR